jgi:hypothetical protein
MRVVHFHFTNRGGTPAYATAWRLVEQPFPRGSPLPPPPLCGQRRSTAARRPMLQSTKVSKLKLWI